MASELNDVVQVVILDGSTAITTASFSIPLVLATFTNFPERTRTYTSITEVGGDFSSTSNAYKMAEKLFGQTSVLGAPPPSIIIGRRQVDEVILTPVVANTQTYTVTINGTDYTYTSDADATAAEITLGLDTVIGSPAGITVTDNLGTLTIAVTTPGTAWSISVSSNLTQANTTPTETWVEALEAVDVENTTWYLLVSETQVAADQEALSDAVAAREKIYGISSADAVAPTTGTTDIGAILNAKSAARTFGVYLPTAATEFPEAAWAGSQLAVTPGSNDWDFKRAVGVTVSKLSSTQITNLKNKSWNYYHAKGGVNIFQNGDMFDKKPIDIQIGKDWLKARLQEGIYFRLINSLKIPMTQAGLVIVENEIRAVLSLAESNGLIDRGWTVQTPNVLSIPATLRAQRAAGVFVINARLQGSIRSVSLQVYLSV